jgi:hypothetical protein
MKRILVLLSVVALMVVMMVVTVAPAFAAPPPFHPTPHSPNDHASDVTNCAADPSCVDVDVGQSHHETFPKGQDMFPPDTP